MRKTIRALLQKTGLSKASDVIYNPIYKLIMTPIKRKKMLKFYSQFISKGDLCFDIGANIGNRVEIFLKLGAKVIAVEPQPACVEVLRKKFGTHPNVTIIPKAVDSKKGTAELYVNPNKDTWTMSSMSKEFIEAQQKRGNAKWNEKISVQTTTADELINEHGAPAFIKIDVEGFEYNVLLGLTSPAKIISFEYTPSHIKPTLQCIALLKELMPDAKYNYSEAETFTLSLKEWANANQMTDIIKTIQTDAFEGDIYVKN